MLNFGLENGTKSIMKSAGGKHWWPLGVPAGPTERAKSHNSLSRGNEEAIAQSGANKGTLLPFRIQLVRNDKQLDSAVRIRHAVYQRHLPTLAELLTAPEEADKQENTIVLLATAKVEAAPLGTMRIHTNSGKLVEFERELKLPERYQGRTIAHVARLAVANGPLSGLVKLSLFKALHRYCLALQIDYMMVAGKPPIDRQYERLGFEDVFSEDAYVSITSSGGIPVRVMAFELATAEQRWRDAKHPLYKFMIQEFHPDIEIFQSVSSMWSQPRRVRRPPGPIELPNFLVV